MYQYIPLQAFNKTCGFPTHPERVRRDKIKAVQLLCIGYDVTMAIFKTTQVQLFQSTCWYILVYTGIYFYIVEKNGKLHLIMCRPPSRAYESADCLAWSFLPVFSLTAVSSTVRPPRRGLPRPKFHSHVLTSYTLLPRLPSEAAVSANIMGKTELLCLLNLCGIVGVELKARNKG